MNTSDLLHRVLYYYILNYTVRRKCMYAHERRKMRRCKASVAYTCVVMKTWRDAARKSSVVPRNRLRTTSHQSLIGSRPPPTNRTRSERAACRVTSRVPEVFFVLSARGVLDASWAPRRRPGRGGWPSARRPSSVRRSGAEEAPETAEAETSVRGAITTERGAGAGSVTVARQRGATVVSRRSDRSRRAEFDSPSSSCGPTGISVSLSRQY